MGVEYRHFLVAGDSARLPQSDTLTRVDAVLRKWGLVAGEPGAYDLSGGKQVALQAVPNGSPGPGVLVQYPTVEGEPVSAVLGPSAYEEVGPSERYLERISVVVGSDFRVHWSSESVCFSVAEPAYESGRAVEPYSEDAGTYLYAEAYPAGPATTPPDVFIERESDDDVTWQDYSGVWRGAVVLDCGKDLPGFAERADTLPCREFVAELEEALRSPLYEVGEYD